MGKYTPFVLLFLGIIFISANLSAQEQDTTKLFKQADEFFELREYLNAMPGYESVLQRDSNNVKANFKLGLCELNSLNKEKSLFYLFRAFKRNPKFDPLFEYYLAEAYKYNNVMAEAISRYELMKQKYANINGTVKVINDKIDIKDFLLLLEQRIKECKFGIKFFADPTNARVRNIGKTINSEAADYAPVISADETILIFTSRRKGSTGGGVSREDNLPFEDIYESEKKRGKWTNAKNIGKPINTKFHEASIGLSADGKTLYTYHDENGGDIYVSELSNKNDWSVPAKMGGDINTKYRETSFSTTKDGNTAYFASDRPGGFGGLDIYTIKKDEKGNWGKAVNLGAEINTEVDEDAPFIHFDSRTLYFSSRAHETIGGYDIFYSELINNKWSKPISLGSPINTTNDDTYFVLSADYKRGYYASAKKGGFGDKDIYIVDMPDYRDVEVISFQLAIKTISVSFNPLITNDPKRAIIILRGVVKDEDTDILLSSRMTLYDVEENSVVEEINSISPLGVYYTTMNTGRKYLLYVQKEGYLYHSEYFEIPIGVVNQEKVLNIYLKRININKSIDFKALYDYNSAKLTKQSVPALERLLSFLEANPRIKGEIEGHTDNIGTDQRNMVLSTERAKSVYDYLISKGIDENRLSFIGYGFHKPVETNDTPHGRQLNRRTEFKILEINN